MQAGATTFTGHSQPDVQYKANAVKTSAKGYRSIWFRNGNTTIDIAYPAYYMRGEHVPSYPVNVPASLASGYIQTGHRRIPALCLCKVLPHSILAVCLTRSRRSSPL